MYHPKHVTYGAFDDWCYDHLGIFAWTVEVWDIVKRAGTEERKFIEWARDHPVEDDLKILAWVDDNLEGEPFVTWKPFDHPQLGLVDIGGWDDLFVWRNPPTKFLKEEISKVADFILSQAAVCPKLQFHSVEAVPLGGDNFRVSVVIENTGYLATDTSQRARERRAVKSTTVTVQIPDGTVIVHGRAQTEIGPLEGRSNKFSVGGRGVSPTDNRCRLEWTISGTQGTDLTIVARSERAGTVRRTIQLP
jgi:murein tripeptide amidase MpaA